MAARYPKIISEIILSGKGNTVICIGGTVDEAGPPVREKTEQEKL